MTGSIHLPEIKAKNEDELMLGLYSLDHGDDVPNEGKILPENVANETCKRNATYRLNIDGHDVGEVQTQKGNSYAETVSEIIEATREMRHELSLSMDLAPPSPGIPGMSTQPPGSIATTNGKSVKTKSSDNSDK